MKLTIEKNQVVAKSETLAEAQTLLATATEFSRAKKEVVKTPRKKPLHFKLCDVCGKRCKGNIGLGIHKKRIHGSKQATTHEPNINELRKLIPDLTR